MADLIAKQAALAKDAAFQDRVKLAMMAAMTAVQGEVVGAQSTNVYQKRQQHSSAVLASPNGFVDRYAWAVAQNSTIGATIADPKAITSSTNATPIVVTTATHGYTTGDTVEITGHLVNTNANGTWIITVLSTTTFSLPASGNGVGAGTGGAYKQPNDSDIQFTVNSLINDFAGVTSLD